ncbi:MAG: hypothetical protein ACRCT8_11910 [Lacipirellulaceae bacterium]
MRSPCAAVALSALVLLGGFAAPAAAQSIFATSIFSPVSGDPDPGQSGVLKIDSVTGAVTTLVPESPATGLLFPSDIEYGFDGWLYVSTQLGSVFRFDPQTGAPGPTLVDGAPAGTFAVTAAGINRLYIDDFGDLVVAESSGAVAAYDTVSGERRFEFGSTPLTFPAGVSQLPNGDLIATSGEFGAPASINYYTDGVWIPIVPAATSGVFGGSNVTVVPGIGDYNFDGVTNQADRLEWENNYNTDYFGADGNGDGWVDAADYTVWRDFLGDTARIVVTDLVANQLVSFAIDGSDRRTLAAILPTVTFPLPPGVTLPSNSPSETLLSEDDTLIVSVLGLTNRPDNRGAIYEYDLDGNLVRTIASGLPPISGIALGPGAGSLVAVPEPAAATLLALALVASAATPRGAR